MLLNFADLTVLELPGFGFVLCICLFVFLPNMPHLRMGDSQMCFSGSTATIFRLRVDILHLLFAVAPTFCCIIVMLQGATFADGALTHRQETESFI